MNLSARFSILCITLFLLGNLFWGRYGYRSLRAAVLLAHDAVVAYFPAIGPQDQVMVELLLGQVLVMEG